jgi:hypothetical protein
MIEPDLFYSVLCDQVRREDNGKLILIGLFEQIGSATFPMQHPGLCVVNKWGNGEGQFTQQVRIVDRDDNVLYCIEPAPFELPALETTFTAIGFYSGVIFPAPGRAFIEVLLNGELKLRYGLTVAQLPSQPHNA